MRPVCGRCQSRKIECVYDVDQGVTRTVALKRKHASLEDDNRRMQELFGYIRTRAPHEVAEIVKRIRTNSDVFDVLRFVQEGDLLLQQQIQHRATDERTSRIDADALRKSRVKVPAKPWTTVAGDGIVSELVISFLEGEQPYLSQFLEPEAFISEMSAADMAAARYCSPVLVNAICAVSAVSHALAWIRSMTRLTLRVIAYLILCVSR